MKPLAFATPLMFVTLGMLVAVPTASADSCSNTDSGWGKESPDCNFGCSPNDYIRIYANVDDNGAIEGSAACGTAGATCYPSTSSCSGSSAPTVAVSEDVGVCQATGNGGGPWTRAYVNCWTQSCGACTPNVIGLETGGVTGLVLGLVVFADNLVDSLEDSIIGSLTSAGDEASSARPVPLLDLVAATVGEGNVDDGLREHLTMTSDAGSQALLVFVGGAPYGFECAGTTCWTQAPSCVTVADRFTCVV